jgi:hypothetical protein
LKVRSRPYPERQRREASDRRDGRHQNRTKAASTSLQEYNIAR